MGAALRIGPWLAPLMVLDCTLSDVSVSDEKWQCAGGSCEVTFNLENLNHNQIDAHVAIRAHRRYSVEGSEAWRNEIISEVTEVMSLQPTEKRRIKRKLKVPTRPDNVVVSAWIST